MNFDEDEEPFSNDEALFGDDYFCNSPIGGDPGGYDDRAYHEPIGDDLSGMQFDNSLAVPMDDFQSYPNDLQSNSRDFQTLQPPVSSAYDMDMGHSQSSMGMGGYSNGGTSESMLYEQTTTISNGDHQMMGGNEDPYGIPSTSFGSYQPSPMGDHNQSSPSVSRSQSRPSSRTPLQKGAGLVQHLNAPSTSSYNSSPAPPPVKATPAKKAAPQRAPNGSRKKNPQGANTVGAVLTKANKLAATPAAATSSLRLSGEDTLRVAQLTAEIEKLQASSNPRDKARAEELSGQRAQIFFAALASQQNISVPTVTPSQTTAPRPRTSHKKQAPPSSPGYMPQGAATYNSAIHDEYAAVPGPSHGFMSTPTPPPQMQQRGFKGTPGPPHAGQQRGPAAGGGGIFVHQQQQIQHGQPPPQMMTPSSMMMTSVPAPSTTVTSVMRGTGRVGPGARTMMMRGGPQPQPMQQLQPQSHPGLQQHPPETTVRAALKQGTLQHLQLNNQLQQQTQSQQRGPMHHMQQQHRQSPMPSTSSHQQPQPLLQLSLPVHQQQVQQIRMEEHSYRPSPQVTARRMEEKRMGRQRKLQAAFDTMSQHLLQPETEVPFAGVDDVFRRLMPYHLLYEHDLDPQLEEEFDLQFMRSMVETDERKRRLTERMRTIAIDEAVAKKDEECNLLLFLDAEYEREQLEKERRMAREEPDSLHPIVMSTCRSLSEHPKLPAPSTRLAELKQPEGFDQFSSRYEYHPFVERRRAPTPPPLGPLHGLEESEVEEDDTGDEREKYATAAAGPSTSSFNSFHPTAGKTIKIKPAVSSDEDDEASPEMGCLPADLPQRSTVPHAAHSHRPATVPSDRAIKQEVASPRPAAAAAVKVQPAQPIKQEVASPARTKPAVAKTTVPSRHEMPAAIPVPLVKRNRMMEDSLRVEQWRKKEEEREKRAAETRKKEEESRKERERKGRREEEVRRAEEAKRKEEEEKEKEKERLQREEEEVRRKREEMEREEPKKVMMPLKIKFKIAAREEEKREEEERENRDKKSKKKRKKEKRERAEEEDGEEERQRKRRKKEKKERERQAAAAAETATPIVPAPAATPVTATTTPVIPKLKIKFGGGGGVSTPASTPAAVALATVTPVRPTAAPVLTPIVAAAAIPVPPTTPAQQLQPVQPPVLPLSVPKLKIKIGLPASTPSPSKEKERREDKEERRRGKEEKRKENGHKEKHHHKHKEHNHKEHKSERRHREQQSQSQPTVEAPAAQPRPHAASQPVVPTVKISMKPPRPAPTSQPNAMVAAAISSVQHMQQPMPQLIQQQMAMNAQQQLFRPSVIATPPLLQPMQHLQQMQAAAAVVMGLPQQPLLPPPVVAPLILGLARLPPGPEENSPPRVNFSDSEDEEEERSKSLQHSAAAITRMVGHAPTLLPQQHHHRLPQPQLTQPAFPHWNNQYQ